MFQDCGTITKPDGENGFSAIITDGSKYGAKGKLVCPTGFKVNGTNNTVESMPTECLSSGIWSLSLIQCVKKGTISSIMFVQFNSLTHQTHAHF